MKKISVVLIAVLALVVSACATPVGAATGSDPTPQPGAISTAYANALPVPSQLALGIIQLKGTANAVTKAEATSLLPLFEAMKTLVSSTNPAQAEVDALIKQIQGTLTPAQLQAISAMKLTQADVFRSLQTAGLLPSFNGGANGTPPARTPNANGSRGGGRTFGGGGFGGGFGGGDRGGGGFGGGFGGGGFGGGNRTGQNGSNNTPSTQATVIARQAQRAQYGNVLLYTAVVTFLQHQTGQ